ncbi:hypothetical protein MLD38_011571 [Melastoma candidum]|uniref:Uncharacterized protein n=1 Tax=Melastoma candidum TaxID=119954 RepID=A0ACB9R6I3_9MYRT|nr:hypothetical protein MLD38_011571 [Melastoma candidum]
MGEDSRTTDFRRLAAGGGDGGCNGVVPVDCVYQDRVIEWEHGLPDCGDLTPLSQALVPPELASAFSITQEASRTVGDVALASRSTLANLRGAAGAGASSQAFSTMDHHGSGVLDGEEHGRDEEGEDDEEAEDLILDRLDDDGEGGGKKQLRKSDSAEEADSAMDGSKAAKRQRLVWTPQLHKRFVDVVSHLGIKNAVPKTIMQLMNVEGLTRENVASHLQKYRLYLKRMQSGGGGSMIGNSDGGGCGSVGMAASMAMDHLFASTPVPLRGANNENGGSGGGGGSGTRASSLRHTGYYGSYGNGDMGNGHIPMPMMMGYGVPGGMVGMPVNGIYGAGHPGIPMDGNHHHHQCGTTVPHPPQSGNASNDK